MVEQMRILILSDRYLPDNSGTALRSAALATGLVRQNATQAHVATLTRCMLPGLAEGNQPPGDEDLDGVRVHRFSSEKALALGLPTLHRRFHFDLIHGRGPRYGFYARMLGMLFRIPSIVELNYIIPQQGLLRRAIWHYTLQSASRLVVLSDHARKWATEDLGVSPERIDVVINGIDLSRFSPEKIGNEKKALLGLDDHPIVGYVGTFIEWQGVLEFVRVAALVAAQRTDARFLMVGYGPDFERTKQMITELALDDRFVLTGNVPPAEVPSCMMAMDVVLLARPPQLLNQVAVPLKLLEAMAMGRAIVVTPVRGLCELVRDRETGVVAGPSTEDIASAVLGLLDDSNMRVAIGKSARQSVETRYTWESAVSSLLTSYQRVLHK